MIQSQRRLAALAALVFAAFAANFLYFFVDDEGIPFVYAQNLLAGHGVACNTTQLARLNTRVMLSRNAEGYGGDP
jgi:hypothetical protein